MIAPMPTKGLLSLEDALPILRKLNVAYRILTVDATGLAELPRPCIIMDNRDRQFSALLRDPKNAGSPPQDAQATNTGERVPAESPSTEYRVLLLKPESGQSDSWNIGLLRRMRGILLHIIVASTLINILALTAPLVSLVVFNKVLPHAANSTLTVVVIGALVLYCFDALLRSARSYMVVHTGARIEAILASGAMAELLRRPIRYFETASSGTVTEHLRQVDTIRTFLTGEAPILLVDFFFAAVMTAILFIVDWHIGLLVAFFLPLFVLISFAFDSTQSKLEQQQHQTGVSKSSLINEIIRNAVTIKAIGLEPEMQARFGDQIARTAWTNFKAANLAAQIGSIAILLQAMASLVILFLGANLIIKGTLTIGELIAANLLASRILSPARQIATIWHRLRASQRAYQRLGELMATNEDIPTAGTMNPPTGPLVLSADSVGFSHDGQSTAVIAAASLTLRPGTITALVGRSGCGKTTLGKLLAGLYQPKNGRITIAGLGLAQLSPASLRRSIGYVLQDCRLFSGSVLDNLLMGNPGAEAAKAIRAAKLVGAHEFIERLPSGYQTQIAEMGIGLSAGQCQLLCIARALAGEPPILILDEATSALDPTTEERFMHVLRQLVVAGRISALFITHRTNCLRYCDRVAVLSDGVIVTNEAATPSSRAVVAGGTGTTSAGSFS